MLVSSLFIFQVFVLSLFLAIRDSQGSWSSLLTWAFHIKLQSVFLCLSASSSCLSLSPIQFPFPHQPRALSSPCFPCPSCCCVHGCILALFSCVRFCNASGPLALDQSSFLILPPSVEPWVFFFLALDLGLLYLAIVSHDGGVSVCLSVCLMIGLCGQPPSTIERLPRPSRGLRRDGRQPAEAQPPEKG